MTGSHHYLNLKNGESFLPLEEKLELSSRKKTFTFGIPCENSELENRVVLAPAGVSQLVNLGHRVLIETGAGNGSKFTDHDYSESGGEIVHQKEEVFKADIILKVAPLNTDDTGFLKQRQIILSALMLPSRDVSYFRELMNRKVTAIAFEKIQDKSGSYPLIKAMAEIVGNMVIIIASEYLRNPSFGRGIMFGGFPGITPTEVVILGAGTVAENAAKSALGMGAQVKVFDNSIYKLRRIQESIGNRVFTSILQPKILDVALKSADVVIGAIHSGESPPPLIITQTMVGAMKPGSIIIDVSIDQGGCTETSHLTSLKDPAYRMMEVTHYCVPNIASLVPYTASYAINNFFVPLLTRLGEFGSLESLMDWEAGLAKGVYLYNGILTNKQISDLYDLPFQDLNLLRAAFH